MLLLTLRGTPFLYAGEELGLEDAVVDEAHRVDPGGRDGCRAPLPWTAEAPHGWDGAAPWLPWPPEPGRHSVAAERADPDSMLHLYRRVLRARHGSPALTVGAGALLDAPDGVLAYERREGDDLRLVLVNFTGEAREAPGAGVVEVASDGAGEGAAFSGRLAPDQAVVLVPAG